MRTKKKGEPISYLHTYNRKVKVSDTKVIMECLVMNKYNYLTKVV